MTDLAKLPEADRNPAATYLAGLTETGRRGMLSRLRKVAQVLGHDEPGTVPWQDLRYQHVAAVRARLMEDGEAAASVNLALCALRRIAKEAFLLGHIGADELARVQAVPSVRGERLLQGRALSSGELVALMEACSRDAGPGGARDAALIGLLYAAGLRRAEVVGLDRSDYDTETGELRVRGKGDKQRLLFVDNGAAEALADWLAVRGDHEGPLFHPVTRGGRVMPRRMDAQTVYDRLRCLAERAKVKGFTPHDLRRTFISDQLDAGTDLATVQAMAGHADPKTTTRYDRRGDEAKRRAAKALHVPYVRRQQALAEEA